jgi:hypothetical protein
MRLSALFAALVAGWLVAGPVAAQQQQQPVPADEDFPASHLALAQEIVTLTRSDEAFDDILPRLAQQTQSVLTRGNPALTREIEDTVMDVALEMAGRRTELARTIQLIWARRFTEEELRQLKTFFESELGQKFTELTPVITALSVGAARQWEQELSRVMVDETRERLREAGHSL